MELKTEFRALVSNLLKNNNFKNISWSELMLKRLEINEILEEDANEGLSQYEEKIAMKNRFNECQVPTTKVNFELVLFS